MPRALNAKELKERDRQVMEAAKLTEQLQNKGWSKAQIKPKLRSMGFKYRVIRAAFKGIEYVYPVHHCEKFIKEKFNGRTIPGRRVVEAGLKAGYSRQTIYRALAQCAKLKRRGKSGLWQVDWRTERRNFLGEINGEEE